MSKLADQGFLHLADMRLEYRMIGPRPDAAATIVLLHEGLGSVEVWGGFADEIAVAAERTMPIPTGMDYVTAAGFTMTYGTSYYALKQRAALRPAEALLVLGAAGGVGLAAVELGRVMGARVIAAAGTDEKLTLCRRYGADAVINYSRESLKDRVKELTDGHGADVIYDPVGGDAFDQAMRCINWNGRLLIIGFASGRIPQLPVNLALLKGCAVVGVFWGAFTAREPEANEANLAELGRWVEEGTIKPYVCKTLPLERVAEALEAIEHRQALGKIVLTTGRD